MECFLEEAGDEIPQGLIMSLPDGKEAMGVFTSFLLSRKFSLNILFICWKEEMDLAERDSNQARVFSRRVVVKAKHFTVSDVRWKIRLDSKLCKW